MELPLGWSVLLVVSAVWNLAIWPRFWQRIARDPRSRDAAGRPTRFRTVHAALIGISLLLALAVGTLGVISLALAVDTAT